MDASLQPTGLICDNPDCRIAETGKCVEGLEQTACPHFGKEPATAAPSDAPPASLELPSGRRLDREEAGAVLRQREARVVAIVGPRDAGKTSFIASLYDLFQIGTVADWLFGGSQTLHAFEFACHDGRAPSRRDVPDMHRTPVGDVQFYHLNVAHQGSPEVIALLLGDRSGELYSASSDDSTQAKGFDEVHRADVITLLVDGERLADAGKRHNAQMEVRTILRVLVEANLVNSRQRLAIVLTKADVFIKDSTRQASVESDFNRLARAITNEHSPHFAAITTFITAASPQAGEMMRGTGVANVMAYWLQPVVTPVADRPALQPSDRFFGLLAAPMEIADA
jgi:hypothetical protein